MIQIQLNQKELTRWLNALNNVEKAAKLWTEDLMQRKMAIDYYQLVAKNIVSGKYASGWTYSDAYGPWKASKYPGRPFWKLTGDLMKSLTTWKDSSGGYRSGIPSGVMGGRSWSLKSPKRSISMYGRYGEYGRKGQPARPLFEPTRKEYAADGHKKRGGEILDLVGVQWA